VILFAGIPSETPLALAIAAAERLGLPHVVFNQRHSPYIDLTMAWSDSGLEGALWIGNSRYRLESFTGVYARTIEADLLPEMQPRGRVPADAGTLARTRALTDLFNDLLDIHPGTVANRPSAMGSNLSKPYQAQLVHAAGLLTPETLISNDPEAVRAFHAIHQRIVYKSVSAVRSIVREWSPITGPELSAVQHVPTQFQAFIPGTNIRVHVVGDELFATEITSGAVDYRYGERDGFETRMAAVELPVRIADACRRLTADLGLLLSGIDLKRTPAGEWYCFEVNPSPAYSYFEELGGQPIADALVRALARPAQVG
jgi:glutathione synthase/RimK-type ligase-like ATP-grasp enzyme